MTRPHVENAEIIREYGTFDGVDQVHGVTFDGSHVWFASGSRLHALEPDSGVIERELEVPADAGTAFDGKHLFQIAEAGIQKIRSEEHTSELQSQSNLVCRLLLEKKKKKKKKT